MKVLCLPSISLTVSGLKGAQVPLDRADCSSSAEIAPLRSLSTLLSIVNTEKRRKMWPLTWVRGLIQENVHFYEIC